MSCFAGTLDTNTVFVHNFSLMQYLAINKISLFVGNYPAINKLSLFAGGSLLVITVLCVI
jgi:hypothetical protein